MTDPNRTSQEWADLLKLNWERRASSDSRDFFVASHPGWQDETRWDAQAKHDIDHLLTGLNPSDFPSWHVLEIGCGVGRLAKPLASMVETYTGFDIAPSMVEEARSRNAALKNLRFFVGDGISVPTEAKDRSYNFILSLGVFIHLPKDVIAALISDAYTLLAPGGQIRYQVLADPEDPTAVPDTPESAAVEIQAEEMEAGATDDHRAMIDDQYFMGDNFRYDDLKPFLEAAAPSAVVETIRLDVMHIYGWIEKPR